MWFWQLPSRRIPAPAARVHSRAATPRTRGVLAATYTRRWALLSAVSGGANSWTFVPWLRAATGNYGKRMGLLGDKRSSACNALRLATGRELTSPGMAAQRVAASIGVLARQRCSAPRLGSLAVRIPFSGRGRFRASSGEATTVETAVPVHATHLAVLRNDSPTAQLPTHNALDATDVPTDAAREQPEWPPPACPHKAPCGQ